MLLYITNQLQNIGSNDTNIMIIYFLSITIAIAVIIVKSPVVSILNLIALFCTIAIYLVKSGMVFAGLMYLLVYVGAISILFIFIVMLINVRISELVTEGKNGTFLSIMSVVAIYFLFSQIIPGLEGDYTWIMNQVRESYRVFYLETFKHDLNISSISSKSWDVSINEITHISSIGNILYSHLLANLIVLGLLILKAMIGAIVITVKSINKLPENDLNTNVSTSINLNS